MNTIMILKMLFPDFLLTVKNYLRIHVLQTSSDDKTFLINFVFYITDKKSIL